MAAPDVSSVLPILTDVGLLIDLFTGTEDSPSFNPGWFSDPVAGFESSFDWPNLQPLVEKILGKAANPLDTNAGPFNESWYSIKITDAKDAAKDSGFYFVEKTIGDNALLGVGMQHGFTAVSGKVIIQPFVFVPVFTMPNKAGVIPLFGLDINGPVEIGVEATLTDGFAYAGTTYTGLIFVASFAFDSATPTLTFKLKTATGTFVNVPTIKPRDIFNTVLTNADIVTFLNSQVIPASATIKITWGALFKATGWLSTSAAPYTVGTMPTFATTADVKNYIVSTIYSAINLFLGTNGVIPLIKRDATKTNSIGWSINLVLNNGHYGLNVDVTGVTVGSNPQVKLQLGALTQDKTDWISKAGGAKQVGMGLSFYFLSGTAPNLVFDPQFEMINVGFDVCNANGQPLFDIKGVAMKQAQLRGYFSTLQSNAWGVAAAIDDISLPMVPPSSGGGSSVPSTLMSSASTGGSSGSAKPPVNPEFSFIAAYQKNFYFQLFDKDGKAEDIVVLPVQKSFGPVSLKDIGIGWKQDNYQLLFELDGGLNLNALKLDLEKLTIGVPVKTPGDISNYSLDLDGFDLSFSSGPVSLTGGFLKDSSVSPTEYNGAVSIQAAKWGITALGSFASLNGHPSLFIFGVLDAELGGPPFFFITGVAVGFGYNRKITMPSIDNVQNFPFVQAAVNPSLFSGSTDDILNSISSYIPPELGEYWLAAGIKFTSFELVNSFALLMIQFGNNFELDMLGMSTLQLPKKGEGTTYVNVEMAVKVVFSPADGVLGVQAQLTNNSYVIDPDCVITGGFAFYTWFSGPHSGDFVVTIGGYNAFFTVPSYYPTVPRLGYTWNVSSNVTISGSAYFALTPSCVMAGAALSLVFSDGDLNAWFNAHADFLISWKPFHYNISLGITIGASYRLNLLFVHTTITVELSVDVDIWGPDFGGQAHVDLTIISFTIGFGADNNTSATVIDWPTFQGYFLPKPDAQSTNPAPKPAPAPSPMFVAKAVAPAAAPASPIPSTNGNVIKINTNAGLSSTFTNAANESIWIVDPSTFAFNTDCVVPATQIVFGAGPGGATDAPALIQCNVFGLFPLGTMTLATNGAVHTITLTKKDEGDGNYSAYSIKSWNFTPTTKNVPQALWGTVNTGSQTPSAASVPNITSGLSSASPAPATLSGPPEFPISILAYTNIETFKLPITLNTAPPVTLSSAGSLATITGTLYNTSTGNQCNGLYSALQDIGSLATQNDSLQALAQNAADVFQGSPMLVNATPPGKTNAVILILNFGAMKKPATDAIVQPAPNMPTVKTHQVTTSIFHYQLGDGPVTTRIVRSGIYFKGAHKILTNLKAGAGSHAKGTFTMQPGQVQIWELRPGHEQDVLAWDGKLALRIIFFDHNLELIDDKQVQKAPGSLTLPQNAVHMVIKTTEIHQEGTLYGWHPGRHLPLLNPKYLMGRGCLIRTQSPHRSGHKQHSLPTGLSRGSKIAGKNRVEGEIERGWTETMFASVVKEVFVLSDIGHGQNNPAMEVKIIYKDGQGQKYALPVSPIAQGQWGNNAWHKFIIPTAITAPYFRVWVQPLSSTQITGVAGSEKVINSLNETMYHQLWAPQAALTRDNMNDFTVITLDHILNEN